MNPAGLRVVSQLDSVAEKIAEGLGGRKSGAGFACKCPCHDDANASLGVTVKDGKLLINCLAGCEYPTIKARLVEMGLLPKNLRAEKKLVATYEYRNIDGTTAFEKLRYEPKTFRIRRWDSSASEWVFRGATKDAPRILYQADKISDANKRGDTIIICEGEKDCDAINELRLDGVIATTNFEGAGTWLKEYTAQVAGAKVLILEDNDEAGRKRTAMLGAALNDVCPEVRVVRFADMPPKSDFSDWLNLKPRSREDVIAKLRQNERVAVNQWLALEKAEYQHYIDFVQTLPEFGDMRAEMLSGKLFTSTRDGWKPVANMVKVIKSHARAYDCFEVGEIEEHLARYAREVERRLIIDIPEWDGIDRITEICRVVRMANVDSDQLAALLKDFGAGIFRRLRDPQAPNATIILTGPQGIGKDAFIQAVFGGLGTYFKDLDLRPAREHEAIKQLHKALLFNIPEFDRTSRTEIATLKYMLTTPRTDTRLSYEADDETRAVRASFISSANIEDVVSDYTGNRRYWVFKCDYMGLEVKHYPGKPPIGTGRVLDSYPGLFGRPERALEQAMILAQFKELEAEGYRADAEDVALMRDYVSEMTPDDPEKLIIEEYEAAMATVTAIPAKRSAVDNAPLFTVDQLDQVLSELARKYGKTRQALLRILGKTHREKGRERNYYRGKIPYAGSRGEELIADEVPF